MIMITGLKFSWERRKAMKVRKILKKTLAVVLAFAMIAPIMGKLEVNVKEAKASEATSNVESDDSLDVKLSYARCSYRNRHRSLQR